MKKGAPQGSFRVAQPSRLLVEASRLDELPALSQTPCPMSERGREFASARRRCQHSGRVRYPGHPSPRPI